MAIPVLLYGYVTWTLKKRDWNRIQAAEIKYLRTVKCCTKIDQLRNEDIQKELGLRLGGGGGAPAPPAHPKYPR
jgi:hypothetical protein